ncbi:IclR family transcriptional regulator C-terminal domain-containing protein [uncultured Corynebacterium sp.]|uniref:IclR family transcriptional regulator domain-containing protein n=1 Tax=uncultured Corynebacterium sp. TaxID=159447 RepID=UPI0025E62C70|nr:IclR family transcriptional regulator C-terminal domain-containing protein [uncultured Corynebacterium sp.]
MTIPKVPATAEPKAPDALHVQSLARGLSVIRAFGAERPRQTLAQVADATGLARATTRRFLHTLVDLGYAGTDGSEFWLTPRILELGYSYLSSLSLPAIAQPRLEQLSSRIGESSSMSVLDGPDIVYVSRVPVRRIMTVSITIGTRFPAYATSMGRVLLSEMPDDDLDAYFAATPVERLAPRTIATEKDLRKELKKVRLQGWALVDQELEPGLRSLAAPIRGADGRTVAAINVSTQTAAHGVDDLMRDFLPAVLDTATAIGHDLAAQQQR